MADDCRPRAIFMAFGTQGDVFPIAIQGIEIIDNDSFEQCISVARKKAIASAFACDQQHYQVVLITHLAHQSLRVHLAEKNVIFIPLFSPPVLSVHQFVNSSDSAQMSFHMHKRESLAEHRQECLSAVEGVLGDYTNTGDHFIVINFFALEGWHLAEMFQVRCVIASPYVVPYSAPSAFDRRFKLELPQLYKCLQEAPPNMANWSDITHWMWSLFTEDWATWRSEHLKLSPIPFMDPVTNLPMVHTQAGSPLLIYGFSKEIVEIPGYWPLNIHICGFWFLPFEWQFSCNRCKKMMSPTPNSPIVGKDEMCTSHADLQKFLATSSYPCFIGLSSIGSMGFLQNPRAFLVVLKSVIEMTEYSFILFSAGYEPLDAAIKSVAGASPNTSTLHDAEDSTLLFKNRLYCFSGSIPYSWLFPKCAIAVHHGGSGSTAAALHAGIPQVLYEVVCPFILDQFYWAERLFWIGVAPEPLRRWQLIPENDDATSVSRAADSLARAIKLALSSEIKSQASKVADMISSEDGLKEALRVLKEKVPFCSS